MLTRGVGAAGEHAGWDVLIDYAAGTMAFINGVTTLFSFTDYGDVYSELRLLIENDDASNAVRGQLDGSHGGTFPCTSLQGYDDAAPQSEGCAKIAYPNPFTFVRGQVLNSSGSSVQGRWALLGKLRTKKR